MNFLTFTLLLTLTTAAQAHIRGRPADSGPFHIIARATPYGMDQIRYQVHISALPATAERRQPQIDELQLARLENAEYLLALRTGEPTEVFELRGKIQLSANRLSIQQLTRTRSYLQRVGILQGDRFLRYPSHKDDTDRIVIERSRNTILFLVLETSSGYGQDLQYTRFKVRPE